MPDEQANPLRVRPAWLLVLLMWASLVVPPRLIAFSLPTLLTLTVGLGGGLIGYVVWWLAFSRAPLVDRLAGLALFVCLMVVGVSGVFHHTASQFMPVVTLLLPAALTAATVGMLLAKPLPWRTARWVAAVWLLMAVVVWSGVRVDGADGTMALQLSWRGMPSAEEVYLAQLAQQPRRDDRPADQQARAAGAAPSAMAPEQVTLAEGDWPGFRGPQQDGVYRGPAFPTNWDLRPPKELWRRRVGPGWSSFAVVGDRLYTQEQRGEFETTVCYIGATGQEAWTDQTAARFYKVESAAGPLATPSFHDGALYVCGAEGDVCRLDAVTGEAAWRRRLTNDLPRDAAPEWGFASSPLIVPLAERALVVVYAGNPDPGASDDDPTDAALIAYDSQSGEPVWIAGAGYHAYSTPLLAELGGVAQVLCASNAGLESLDPASGERLWFYEWSTGEFPRIAQPIVVDDQTVVLASGYGYGAHAIEVRHEDNAWTTKTVWQSRQLAPYFNDCLHHDGYLYGFSDKFFTCLDAKTGELAWPKKTRRRAEFGCGQVVLAEKSGVLLVMTEHTGELVLLEAQPGGPREIARVKVLEGKTWNHPVIAHDRIYVRNGVEAACYELPPLDVASRSEGRDDAR